MEEKQFLFKDLLANWDDKNNFAYPSSVLPDRTLIPGSDGFVPWPIGTPQNAEKILNELYSEDSSTSPLGNLNAGEKIKIIQLPGYRKDFVTPNGEAVLHPGNPQTPRPLTGPLAKPTTGNEEDFLLSNNGIITRGFLSVFSSFGLPYLFGINSGEDSKLTGISLVPLLKLRATIYNSDKIHSLLSSTVVDHSRLVETLADELSITNTENICLGCILKKAFGKRLKSVPAPVKEKSIEVTALNSIMSSQRIIKLGTQMCSACHGKGSGFPLPLDNPKQFSQYKSQLGLYADERIVRSQMPPASYKKVLAKHYKQEYPNLDAALLELARGLKSLRGNAK